MCKKTGKGSPSLKYAFDIMCFNQNQVLVIWNNIGGPPLFQNQLSNCDKQSVSSQFLYWVIMILIFLTMQLRIDLALTRSIQEMNKFYQAKWVRSYLFNRNFLTREQTLVVGHKRRAEVQQNLSKLQMLLGSVGIEIKLNVLQLHNFGFFANTKKGIWDREGNSVQEPAGIECSNVPLMS